jgi:general secretion pathway protein D
MLEVEVLEVSRARLTDIGVQFPNKLSLTPLQSVVSAPSSTGVAATASQLTLGDLRNITKNSLGINVPTLTLNAMLQDSDTNILSSPRLRVRNREKAKIMIGERVPMITNSITPVSTGTPVVTGSVTYQDVGLKLDVEPEIHLDNEVTIKIGLEVSSLGLAVSNASGSDVYRVGTRNTMTTLRLKDGETQILGGLISDQDTNTVDKVPLLGQIPILGHLFASDSGNKSKTEIVLSITPHIVGNFKLADAREMEYWSGTESGLRSSQLVLKPIGVAVLGNNGAVPQRPAPAAAPTASPAPAESDMNSAATAAANKTRKSAQNTAESQTHSPDPRTVVLAWQGPNKAKVGDKIIISLNTPSSQGVKKIELSVGFDPSVFKAVDAVEGDSMKKNKEPSSFNKTIDQAGGEISVEISGSGMSTASSVVSLILEAVTESAETLLSLNSIALSGDNKATLTPTVPDPYAVTVAQ